MLNFMDARDWEEEVRVLKEKVEKGKKAREQAKRKEKSWQDEAKEVRKEWERERRENVMMKNDLKKWQAESEHLRKSLDKMYQKKTSYRERGNQYGK